MSMPARPVPLTAAEQREFESADLPLIATEDVPTCDVCGADTHEHFAGGRDFELRTCRNEWTFVRCRACAHVWLHPRPAIATLPTIYPPHYYAYSYEKTIPWVARAGKAFLDRGKLRSIRRAVAGTVRSYADIGCGTGRYLYAMAEAGVPRDRVHGLELDAEVVARLRADGFAAHHARVETCEGIPDDSLDLATMFHVIEHVEAPSAVLIRLARWIVPGGVLALETPNLDSVDARIFGERWWGGYHIPRHWHLFTPATLERLLRSHGFEPFAIRYRTGHSFWMYSLHHRFRYAGEGRPRLGRWFDPMRSAGLLAALTLFDLLRGAAGARTSAMLVLARRVTR